MSVLGYKYISLHKAKKNIGNAGTEYEADLTDAKFQEVATALGCNLKIIASGSRWLLYKGTNDENGWLCYTDNNYFCVSVYINGQIPSSVGSNVRQCNVQITISSNVKNLGLTYSKGKNGATLFKFGNEDSAYVLYYCIAEASVIGSDEKICVYGYYNDSGAVKSYYYLSNGENIAYSNDNNIYGYSDNFVLLSAIALKDKNAIIDGLYKCEITKKQTTHYVFDLNDKKYMVCDNGYTYPWAIELDDSMLS